MDVLVILQKERYYLIYTKYMIFFFSDEEEGVPVLEPFPFQGCFLVTKPQRNKENWWI